jgi:hypothetical protein
MPLTNALGQFVADLSPNRLLEEAVRIARLGFIDCIGTMIVGRNEPCAQILKSVLAGDTLFQWRTEPRARGRLDQRHRGARARL